jgi:hypothetical protein
MHVTHPFGVDLPAEHRRAHGGDQFLFTIGDTRISVIRHERSLGGTVDLWELWDHDHQPVGYLTEAEVGALLTLAVAS